jgi:virginiamycin B lyase
MDDRHGGQGPRSRSQERGTSGGTRKRGAIVGVEPLEGRALLSGMINDIATISSSLTIGPMATSREGNLWFAEVGHPGVPALGKVTFSGAKSAVVLPASDAGGTINAVSTDTAGNVWYTLSGATSGQSKVGKVASDGTVSEFPLPGSKESGGAAAIGPDGNLWVAVSGGSAGASLAKVSADGSIVEFPVAGASSLTWLASGTDGNVWFVDGQKIGKITPAGVVTEFPVPAPTDGSGVDLTDAQLASGSDGDMWFIGLGGLSHISPTGTVKTITTAGTQITSLSHGSDGNLWISFLPPIGSPLATTPGALVARVSTAGQITLVPDRVDSLNTIVPRMTSSMDAAIWLDEGGSKLGRLSLANIPTVTLPIVNPVNKGTVSTDANKTINGRIATFTPNYSGASLSDFTASINWGDGTTTAGTVVSAGSGNYDVQGTHTYNAPGGSQQQASITVTGPNAAAAMIFGIINVSGASTPGTVTSTPTTSTPTTTTATVSPTGKKLGPRAAAQAAAREARAAALSARAAARAARHSKAHPKGPAAHVTRPVHPPARKKY